MMTFAEAKEEFAIRYYDWATSEFEKEIETSFPNLSVWKAGPAYEMYQFMRRLGRSEQLTLAHGRLKKFHPEAVKLLGESCSPEEESMLSRHGALHEVLRVHCFLRQLEKTNQLESARDLFQFSRSNIAKLLGEVPWEGGENLRLRLDAFFDHAPPVLDEEIEARRRAGEKVKFASKAKLRRSILTKFKAEFGAMCYDLAIVGMDPELDFKMKNGGWIINTFLDFGPKVHIYYNHGIASETAFEYRGNNIPVLVIGRGISFNSWLGICSQTEWEYLMDEDIQPVCDFIIQRSRHFFEVVPKLLKGLEFESLTEE